MDLNQLKNSFIQQFGGSSEGLKIYFSPGRVNLIGEHTDYNNGYVLPCAITYGSYLLIRKRDDNRIRMASENFDYGGEFSPSDLANKLPGNWMNYPLAVFDQFIKKGFRPGGLNMLFAGNIPNGAGLSSSASIEMVTAFMLNDVYGLAYSMLDLVKMSQKAENEFVGVNCGIMDQFAVGMGKKDCALFLDCGTLDYELVPLDLTGYKIVIANTNKKRGLADSKYNERVAECAKAVAYLSKSKAIKTLSDLSFPEFIHNKHLIPDITIRKRAKHVLSENHRVLDAVNALREDKLPLFGKLMNASHNSLRYDYEVTGMELDVMVEEARKIDGVLGARMTGAGFGGCAIALVEEDRVAFFKYQVGKKYKERTGLEAEFYISEIGDGTAAIDEATF